MGVATSSDDGTTQHLQKSHSAFQAACLYSDIDTTKVDVGAYASKIRAAQQPIPAANAKIVHRIVDSHDCYVRSLVWDPFRDLLVSGGGDGWLRLWKTSDYSFAGEIDSKLSVRSLLVLTQELVSGHSNGEVILWNMEEPSHSIYQRLQSHQEAVYALVTLRSGELVSGAEDIRVFSRGFFGYSHMLTISEEVLCMCSIPSSTSVVTGNMNSMMLVWDTTRSCEHWDVIAECTGHLRSVWTVVYIRETARCASGSADHTIRIWNTANWECELVLKDHTGWVVGLSCSPKGLVSCSIDQGVRLWDCWTWECQREFIDQEYEVYCVCAFSGGRLATGGAEMAILIYGGPEHDKPHMGHEGTAFPGLARAGGELHAATQSAASMSGPPASMLRNTSPRRQDTSKPRAPSTWGAQTAPAEPPSSGYDWMSLPQWVTTPMTAMGLSPRTASASSQALPPALPMHPMGSQQDMFPQPLHQEDRPQISVPEPEVPRPKERRRELQAATAELDFTMSDFRKHIAEVEAEAKKRKNNNPESNPPKESSRSGSPRLSSPPKSGGLDALLSKLGIGGNSVAEEATPGHTSTGLDSPKFGKSKARVAFEDDMLFDTVTSLPNDKDLGLRPTASNAEGVTEWSSALLSRGGPR